MTKHHGHSLAEDLPLIERQLLQRRRALRLLSLTGAMAFLPGCGGGDDAGSTASTGGSGSTSSSDGSCVISSSETNGPYPADGTNSSNGSTSNVLTLASAVRSDIRSSFLGTTTTAAGVRLDLTIRLKNAGNACGALANHAIYLWACDAMGRYSLYDLPNESYMRGIQLTDANGEVSFTTIVPGAYQGRYPHFHVEVFSSLSAANTGRSSLLVSQFALPSAEAAAVYADTAVYGASGTRHASMPLASDGIFRDNSAAQLAQQTIAMSGSPSAGYTGTAVLAISA